jgi:hypothetical protein
MKKRIWLALLPITLLWCGCSEDNYDHTRGITAVASATDVTVSQSTRAAITDTSFGGKDARVLATESPGNYSTLYCNGIMRFKDKDVAARYSSGQYYGENSFPESGEPTTIYLSGLYPATGWGCDTGNKITGGVVTYALDGKTDLMYAPQDEAQKGTAAALTFGHLLTYLKINLVRLGAATVTVHELKLIRTAGDDKLNTVCSVKPDIPSAENAVSFSSDVDSPAELYCWLTSTESEFTGQNIPLHDESTVVEAYILAPPLIDDNVKTDEDYTFHVEYSIDGVENLTKDVAVNLKDDDNKTNYADATAGCSFIINLCFTAGDVAATAEITEWDDKGATVSLILQPNTVPDLTPQGDTGAIDNLTNCYMVKPGDELVFPVKRAYVHGTNILRATDAPYTGGFIAEVLWQDPGVIADDPIVYGNGTDAVIAVETNGGVHGNAVVAIKMSGGDIVWSYHIWVTDYDPDNGGPTWTNPNNDDYTFMNRNLGATANSLSLASIGLMYQWGRKDPFPGGIEGTTGYTAMGFFTGMPDAGTTTVKSVTNKQANLTGLADGIKEGIMNPLTFYQGLSNSNYNWLPFTDPIIWNAEADTKTIYDPCPTGWRVPVYVLEKNRDMDKHFVWPFAGYNEIGASSIILSGAYACFVSNMNMSFIASGIRTINGLLSHGLYVWNSDKWARANMGLWCAGGTTNAETTPTAQIYMHTLFFNGNTTGADFFLYIDSYTPDGIWTGPYYGAIGAEVRCCREYIKH